MMMLTKRVWKIPWTDTETEGRHCIINYYRTIYVNSIIASVLIQRILLIVIYLTSCTYYCYHKRQDTTSVTDKGYQYNNARESIMVSYRKQYSTVKIIEESNQDKEQIQYKFEYTLMEQEVSQMKENKLGKTTESESDTQ